LAGSKSKATKSHAALHLTRRDNDHPVALAKHLGKIRSRLPAWCLPKLLERMSAMRN